MPIDASADRCRETVILGDTERSLVHEERGHTQLPVGTA
jgi:hypothetical protein